MPLTAGPLAELMILKAGRLRHDMISFYFLYFFVSLIYIATFEIA